MCMKAITGTLASLTGATKATEAAQQEAAVIAQAQQQALQASQASSAAATKQADQLNQTAVDNTAADQNAVNSAFSQFNPGYFQNYQNAYTNYYTPQIADQYHTAKDQLTAALSGAGTLESTVGADALANLAKRSTDQTAQIAQQGAAASQSLQGQVASQKSGLMSQANASTDPSQIASNAQAATTALQAPTSFAPLGNVFSDLLGPVTSAAKGTASAAGAQGVPIAQPVTPNAYTTGAQGGAASPYNGTPGS